MWHAVGLPSVANCCIALNTAWTSPQRHHIQHSLATTNRSRPRPTAIPHKQATHPGCMDSSKPVVSAVTFSHSAFCHSWCVAPPSHQHSECEPHAAPHPTPLLLLLLQGQQAVTCHQQPELLLLVVLLQGRVSVWTASASAVDLCWGDPACQLLLVTTLLLLHWTAHLLPVRCCCCGGRP